VSKTQKWSCPKTENMITSTAPEPQVEQDQDGTESVKDRPLEKTEFSTVDAHTA
jgi:hypothetical protein